ncbi:hypothetical protein [Desulforhopalus sp. 52FAK]
MASTRTITPKIVIIGDGLMNARINPASQYVTAQAHLGNREIERLFGFGCNYGNGPLPLLLREAIKAAEVEPRIAVILLQDKPLKNRSEPGSEDDLGVPVEFKDIFDQSLVVETEPRKIAWDQLHAAINSFLGDHVEDQLYTPIDMVTCWSGSINSGGVMKYILFAHPEVLRHMPSWIVQREVPIISTFGHRKQPNRMIWQQQPCFFAQQVEKFLICTVSQSTH